MSVFEDHAAATLSPALLSMLGVSGTYTLRGATSGSTVTGLPLDLPDTEEARQRRYWFLLSALPPGAPLIGDQWVTGSETWTAYGSERPVGGLVPVDFALTQDRD